VCFGRSSVAFKSSYLQAAEDLVTLTAEATDPRQRRQIAAFVGSSGISGALGVFEAILRFVLDIKEYLTS
jgi:hypothetical protein